MDWEELQKLYTSTTPIQEIASRFGLTVKQVHSKARSKGWRRPAELRTSTPKANLDVLMGWNPTFAWWLGWFLTDGSLRGTQFTFVNTERELLERMNAAIGSTNKIALRTRKEGDGHKGDKPVYHTTFRSKELVERLAHVGVTKERDFIPKMPAHLIGHFLRGFFEGDGCFSNGTLTAGGKTGVMADLQLLIETAIPYKPKSLYVRKDLKDFCNLYINKQSELRALHDLLYRDCGETYLPYKKQKYDEWVTSLEFLHYE